MLDSGAFSAHNSGKTIQLSDYITHYRSVLATDPTLREIIALDVIGSAKGSLANSIAMRDAGLNVIPVFHFGDDWAILDEYCSGWSKVGLSCRFGESKKESLGFYSKAFERHWPKRFHSFGWIEETMLGRFPFHSADSSSWEMGPRAFGRWKKFGACSMRGGRQNLRAQVEEYLNTEQRLAWRWAKEMEVLAQC
jgi:hypothetical protein